MRSPLILPSRSYILNMVLSPGLVIFQVFSESLIFGSKVPSSFCIAASLYTPPKAGQSALVISLVPTPQESMLAFCSLSEDIRFSSRSEDATMLASLNPASSSIFLAFFDMYARSPLSSLIPYFPNFTPASFISVNTLIALGTPERRVS